MLKNAHSFNSFATNDIEESRRFYAELLELDVIENDMGILEVQAGGSNKFIIYPKGDNYQAANFTVLNFEVKDIDKVVNQLIAKGITFEQYDDPVKTDSKGISRSDFGPTIAWFKDPAGNILSVIEKT